MRGFDKLLANIFKLLFCQLIAIKISTEDLSIKKKFLNVVFTLIRTKNTKILNIENKKNGRYCYEV